MLATSPLREGERAQRRRSRPRDLYGQPGLLPPRRPDAGRLVALGPGSVDGIGHRRCTDTPELLHRHLSRFPVLTDESLEEPAGPSGHLVLLPPLDPALRAGAEPLQRDLPERIQRRIRHQWIGLEPLDE